MLTQQFGLLVAYVFAVIALAEGLRRWGGWDSDKTRKVVHIGVGMMVWFVPFVFETATPFLLGCAFFAGITYLDNRFHFLKMMASKDDASNWGTFYFPLSAAVVVYLLWDEPALMVAAMMPLTWGDGMAEIIGRRFGRNQYTVFGHTRSFEGSAAFVVFGALAAWLALLLLPSSYVFTAVSAILPALVTAVFAAIAEAVSIGGLDNITVTATALTVLSLWPF